MEDSGVSKRRKKRSVSNRIILKFHFLRFKLLNLVLAKVKLISNHVVYVKGLNKSSLIVDLGANKGEFSKEICKLFNSTCYAIEPNVELCKNLYQENIIALNYAITDSNGPIDFHISNNPESS